MEIKCLIVDDEELAQSVLEKYIGKIPTLNLVGKCDNAVEAISFLHNNKVDLLFLDINMPELSGLDMLKALANPPKVILTTAYSEYALESYEFGVIDYLLKPIKLERFIKAVNKAVETYSVKREEENETTKEDFKRSIFIKEDSVTHNINCEDILFVEAFGNYLKIHTPEKVYVTRETMQNIEMELSRNMFLRIHKSYIINLARIEKIYGNIVVIGNNEIPIGATYRSELLNSIGSK